MGTTSVPAAPSQGEVWISLRDLSSTLHVPLDEIWNTAISLQKPLGGLRYTTDVIHTLIFNRWRVRWIHSDGESPNLYCVYIDERAAAAILAEPRFQTRAGGAI